MPELLSIGRFAHATGLTAKALRLYDRLGLLPPEFVDLDSGYRYYSADQISIARGIHALRSVHMSLPQIGAVLEASTITEVQARLDVHRQWMEDQVTEYEAAIDRMPRAEEWCAVFRKDCDMTGDKSNYRCSFCGKSRHEVRRMIAGPNGVIICNECVAKCNEILDEEEAKAPSLS